MSKIPVFDLPHAVWYQHPKLGLRIAEPRPFHKGAQVAWDDGNVLCLDIISGGHILIPPTELKPVAADNIASFDVTEAWRNIWLAYYEAEDAKLTKLGPGALFSIGCGDGSAHYRVTKVTKSTAQLEWLGLCCDDWFADVFGGGGTFPIKIVERQWKPVSSTPFRKWQGYNVDARTKWAELEKNGTVPKGLVPEVHHV